MDSEMFRSALAAGDLVTLRKVPKADRHNHSMLGCRHDSVEQFWGASLPRFRYQGNGIQDLNDWIGRVYLPVFKRPGAFRAMAEAAFRQALSDGVTVLEMSVDAGLGYLIGISAKEVAGLIRSVHEEVAPAIDFRPELGFARHLPAETMIAWLADYLETGYFTGIDLYDDESAQPVANLRELYRMARQEGLRCKAHAGEFGSAESVQEAVEVLELDAVQHGISAAGSPEVMKWLAERGTQLNIAPTSNVVLERVASMEVHPIRILFDHGVHVTVNTDDVLFFGQGVSEEYYNLYRAGVMTAEELDRIRLASLS